MPVSLFWSRILTSSAFAAVLCAATLASAASAPDPFLEQSDLFHAGQDGYALYRIPGLIITAKGTALAYCEARRSPSDWADMRILMRRSVDGGKTWEPPRNIAEVSGSARKNPVRTNANPAEITYNNPVAIAARDGTIHLLFCLEYLRCFHQSSTNDGLTWSSPAEITAAFEPLRPAYSWKVLATGPGHGIELKSGRLLSPAWLSLGQGRNNHSPSVTASLFSDDQGRTWQTALAIPDTAEAPSPNETAAVELGDGRVLFNARNQSASARRLVATSSDGGSSWSKPRLHPELYEPVCMASLARYPGNAKIKPTLLFAQPAPLADPSGGSLPGLSRDRKNLIIRLSQDDGETWPISKTLEPGPAAYSDLAVSPDGTVLCFYERAEPGAKSPYGRLTLARFNLAWVGRL